MGAWLVWGMLFFGVVTAAQAETFSQRELTAGPAAPLVITSEKQGGASSCTITSRQAEYATQFDAIRWVLAYIILRDSDGLDPSSKRAIELLALIKLSEEKLGSDATEAAQACAIADPKTCGSLKDIVRKISDLLMTFSASDFLSGEDSPFWKELKRDIARNSAEFVDEGPDGMITKLRRIAQNLCPAAK